MGKEGRRRGREKERRGRKGGGGGRSGPEQEICSGNRDVRSVADLGTGGADRTRDVGDLWIPPQKSPGSQLTLDLNGEGSSTLCESPVHGHSHYNSKGCRAAWEDSAHCGSLSWKYVTLVMSTHACRQVPGICGHPILMRVNGSPSLGPGRAPQANGFIAVIRCDHYKM